MLEFFKRLYNNNEEKFYKLIETNLKKQNRMFVITANPETFKYGEEDNNVKEMLLSSNTTLIPDGIGIVKAAHMLNYNVEERITGVDLAGKLLEICNKNKYKLCILGATEEVLTALKKVIKEKYPNIKLGTFQNGYEDNKDDFFNIICKEKPDICLVALGIPAQELLIYKHLEKFNKGIFVGVGGSLDVLSGTKKRAPKLFQKLNIEWLYRLIKEPKRIKRFYQNNVKFIFKVRKLKKERKAHEKSSK